MKKRVLIIEDDVAMATLMREDIEFEGYQVLWVSNGTNGTRQLTDFAPDVVLLDLALPDSDGIELCRKFANTKKHIPIIIVTARGQQEDRIRGLTVGADDYIVKPFALKELSARIGAVLRRTQRRVSKLKLGDTTIDLVRQRAFKGKRELVLTDREFAVIRYLADRPGAMVTRDELLQLVWGYNYAPVTRTVDNFVFRLRQKIEADPHRPKYIRTAYGDGYRLVLDDE